MTWTIDATVAAKIGFASHQNAVPVLRELRIGNGQDIVLENARLALSADPPFLSPKTWLIDRLSPGDDLVVTDRDVSLNASLLSALTECVRGTVLLTLSTSDGAELAVSRHPVELLAHNEWGGLGSMAELLPAFVMPNDPATDHVLKAASDVLRRAGKPDGLDGYSSGRRERVWELASAIWSAVAGLRISYALPPASFERSGQKIRTPGAVLEGRVATCLDTALLFAAALEQAGLNPMIVITKGHAFTGVWLQPVEFANLLTDEAAALRRRFDLDDLLLFETTVATKSPPAGFGEAMAAARRQIAEGSEAHFEMAIDVRRARMQHVRPLGVATREVGTRDAGEASVSEALEAAPLLPAFDVEIAEHAAGPTDRIRQWQRKLLNLTTSNRLLHVPEGAKVLKLMCPDPGALEDMLSSGRKVRVVPMPDLEAGGRDERLFEQQTQTNLREEVARAALARGEALSLLGKDKLDALLIELFRKAKTDLEEGGANTLYLGLGFLKWKKSAHEEKTYRAPLILLPVRLERKSALSGVLMTRHEDEPRFNLTLLELLRQDFELGIPGLDGELPSDQSGVDVAGIWRTVRTAVRDMAGFEVVPDVVLGTFSFAKYLMWKDLVDRADRLKESPLVRHLIDRDGSVGQDRGGFPKPDELDDAIDPSSLFTPLPADSSQLAAVVASARGIDYVLDGPPGTGKSQTIANMIAHNLALGRRVLFVAEKKAALDVVHRRLSDRGLAPFCLELHSAKATKTAVLKQLDRAWSTRDALTAEEWAADAAEARTLRDDLNEVVRLLHRVEPNGWTIHRAIGLAVRDAGDATPVFSLDARAGHDATTMTRLRDVARRLGISRTEVQGLPSELNGVQRQEWSNGWQEAVVAAARAVPVAVDTLVLANEDVRAATGLPASAATSTGIVRLAAFGRTLLEMHGRDFRFAFASDAVERIRAARTGLGLIGDYRRLELELSAGCAPEAARLIDVVHTRAAWVNAEAKFWFFATLAKRRVARDLGKVAGSAVPLDVEADLPRLAAMKDLLTEIDGVAGKAATIPGWAGVASDAPEILQTIELAERLRRDITAQADGPEKLVELRRTVSGLVLDANELLAPDGRLATALDRLDVALSSFETANGRFDELAECEASSDFGKIRLRAEAVASNARRLNAWTGWRRVRHEATAAGLQPLVVQLESGAVEPARSLPEFEVGYARWFASTRIDEEPLLTHFVVGEQEDRIARFRQIDDRMSELSVRYIRAKLCGLIPDRSEVGRKDGYGVLKHQLQLQRAQKPIRQLAADMGDAFTRLAPCMLMSPLSIAQYLPADQALFDLVIFDEASQITPWDAIGAMARGRQVVIAGDPRQMPPSNDFARGASSVSSDDDTESDMDSILDECLGAGVPQHSLDWHYRSRHESLITFSNHRYYDDKLVTFPAPVTRSSAVSWQRVEGVYARGAGRTNPIEAQAVVDAAVARLRDPGFIDAASGRRLTIGIITMNAEQMKLTEDLLDKARRAHPEIEPYFSDEQLEPVVVRNLETAQGDERDLIMLSIGFGPTEPGGRTMSMDFGKLNRDGGWRRLNVAVTRARVEMKVFTSFDPGMIDLTRTSQRAIADLKHFIEFADRGPRALAEAVKGSLGGPDSPFEEAVAWALQRRGWHVVPQVGVSKFRIDLGVVHPDRPGDFLMGVECDGATYHGAATARDRDKVRASILEGLGWSLARVWSTDWWIDKERATEKLILQLEARLQDDRAKVLERQMAAADGVSAAVTPEPETTAPLEDRAEIGAEALAEIEPQEAVVTEASEAVLPGQGVLASPSFVAVGLTEAPLVQPSFGTDRTYSAIRSSSFEATIDPTAFYNAEYDVTLRQLLAQVLAWESPISEAMLVQRVARAHGFLRSGRIIRDRVMAIAEAHAFVVRDEGGVNFVWPTREARQEWNCARPPASDADIRQIEEIAPEELASVDPAMDASAVARFFGIKRLTLTARERIERARAEATQAPHS